MTKHSNTAQPLNPDDAVRARLFKHCETLNARIAERVAHAAGHLANGKATGVLGALDGAEEDLRTIWVLMLFLRDYIPPTT